MDPIVVNESSDFSTDPIVIPAGQLVTITDRYGNLVSHRQVSSPVDQTASSYATTFADPYYAALFPLTVSFSADPNYAPVAPPSTC